MSGQVEVSIVEKPGGGEWRLWLTNPQGQHATVEPVETFRSQEALQAWTRGYETARLRSKEETRRAQGQRRGPRRRAQ